MKKQDSKKPYIIALLLSLLLHVVLFFLLFAGNLLAYIIRQPEVEPETQPLVLELEPLAEPEEEQPPPPPEERPAEQQPEQPLPEKYFRLEENPNANEQTPENADVLAAKSSVSAAPQKIDDQANALRPEKNPEPVIKETPENQPQQQPEETSPMLEETAGQYVYYNKEFSRQLLEQTPQKKEQADVDLSKADPSEIPTELKDFKGDLIGDVALSTYEWKWAPWVLQLKYAFYRHLYVPRAYSMGLIDGYTEVYLKYNREGRLVEHRMIQTAGHQTLKESTINAFVAAAPLRPLPDDFPDEFLELRVRVIYPNLKEWFAQQRGQAQ